MTAAPANPQHPADPHHPDGQPCSGCAALQARVVELELRYMLVDQQLEELTAISRQQADQLDQLARQLQEGLAGGDDDIDVTELL